MNEIQYQKLQLQKSEEQLQSLKKSLNQKVIDLQCDLYAKDQLLSQSSTQLSQMQLKHKTQIQDLQDQSQELQQKLTAKRDQLKKSQSLTSQLQERQEQLLQELQQS
jgi:DNA repair ATPase RecN